MNKQAKIYVAGHLGLVGSALFKSLRLKGYENVVGRSIDELNLMDRNCVRDFFDRERPEYVILAAAVVGGIMANNLYRADFIYDNLVIQNNVIGESFLHNVSKLLYLGSTCIYPRDADQPISEDSLLTGPLEYTNEPYAIAKIAGLKTCESFNLQYGTNYISVMPTNLYGPNDNFHMMSSHVMPAIIRKIHLGNCLLKDRWVDVCADLDVRPVEGVDGSFTEYDILDKLAQYGIYKDKVVLWGTGTPLREFMWSEDMAEACIYIMERVNFSDIIGHNIYSQIQNSNSSRDEFIDMKNRKGGAIASLGNIRNCHINIGTGKEICIKDLARLIARTIGYEGPVVFDDTKPDGSPRKLVNPSKLHALGWHHKIDINDGVTKLYQWYLESVSGKFMQ